MAPLMILPRLREVAQHRGHVRRGAAPCRDGRELEHALSGNGVGGLSRVPHGGDEALHQPVAEARLATAGVATDEGAGELIAIHVGGRIAPHRRPPGEQVVGAAPELRIEQVEDAGARELGIAAALRGERRHRGVEPVVAAVRLIVLEQRPEEGAFAAGHASELQRAGVVRRRVRVREVVARRRLDLELRRCPRRQGADDELQVGRPGLTLQLEDAGHPGNDAAQPAPGRPAIGSILDLAQIRDQLARAPVRHGVEVIKDQEHAVLVLAERLGRGDRTRRRGATRP